MTERHTHLSIGSFPTEVSLRLMKPVLGKGASHTVSCLFLLVHTQNVLRLDTFLTLKVRISTDKYK